MRKQLISISDIPGGYRWFYHQHECKSYRFEFGWYGLGPTPLTSIGSPAQPPIRHSTILFVTINFRPEHYPLPFSPTPPLPLTRPVGKSHPTSINYTILRNQHQSAIHYFPPPHAKLCMKPPCTQITTPIYLLGRTCL